MPVSLIRESLEALHVKCKLTPSVNDRGMETMRLRVGGHDLRRKEMFKGWVEVERFIYR